MSKNPETLVEGALEMPGTIANNTAASVRPRGVLAQKIYKKKKLYAAYPHLTELFLAA